MNCHELNIMIEEIGLTKGRGYVDNPLLGHNLDIEHTIAPISTYHPSRATPDDHSLIPNGLQFYAGKYLTVIGVHIQNANTST